MVGGCKQSSSDGGGGGGTSSGTRIYDDIWILRYVLSHTNDIEAATQAAIRTMIFRDKKKLNNNDLRHRIQNYGDIHDQKLFHSLATTASGWCSSSSTTQSKDTIVMEPLPGWNEFNQCCDENTGFFLQPDANRGVIEIFDFHKLNHDIVLQKFCNQEKLVELNLYINECLFQVLDEVTRRTGKLTKYCQIVDVKNVQFQQINQRSLKADADSRRILEDYYPQLLQTMFIVNSPSWASVIWTFIKPFLPNRVIGKVDFISPNISHKEKKKKNSKARTGTSEIKINKSVQSLLRYISNDNLPEIYGGKNQQWPMECLGRKFQKQRMLADTK